MKRREFIALLGGAALCAPLTARAQQPAMPVIGYLSSFSNNARLAAAFNKGLKELGFVVDQNVAIEYRYAEGHYDQLPALAADLVHRQVAVICAVGGNAPGKAAKAATSTIPIVFGSGGGDPVNEGLVASLNRPGGNVTGISMTTTALGPKRFELLHQLVPKAEVIGVLTNPNYGDEPLQISELEDAAASIKRAITIASAGAEGDLDPAVATLVQHGANALFVTNDPNFTTLRNQIIALAARYALPAAYYTREFVEAGGLMSYGTDFPETFRQVGNYVGRILKGERPADLPVMQSTKFELVLNLKTAKTLGLEIPPQLLALADEAIE
jgi:putative ABC transport system substrate-binding protein